MKAYKKQEVFQFKFLDGVVVVNVPDSPFAAGTYHVLIPHSDGKLSAISDKEFSDRYEYVFKGGITGECRLKRVIDDVEVVSEPREIPIWGKPTRLNVGDYVIWPECSMPVILSKDDFEEAYELTQSDEDIVEAFRRVDAGMGHNTHLSHSNVVMISRDHYAALCDLAYGLPNGLTVGSDLL